LAIPVRRVAFQNLGQDTFGVAESVQLPEADMLRKKFAPFAAFRFEATASLAATSPRAKLRYISYPRAISAINYQIIFLPLLDLLAVLSYCFFRSLSTVRNPGPTEQWQTQPANMIADSLSNPAFCTALGDKNHV
jgi:hypothetical protein